MKAFASSVYRFVLGMAVATAVTACGGGGGDAPTPQPQGTIAVFATGSSPSFAVPITVYINNDNAGTITQNAPAAQTAPTGTAGATELRVNRAPGSYRIRAVGANGQIWTSNVTVNADAVTAQQLVNDPAQLGRVTFWRETGGTATDNITVTLDVNDELGTLSGSLAAAPTCGVTTNALSGLRRTGTYTYIATNAAGTCTWTGTFQILPDNGCTLVRLGPCTP